MKLYHGTSAALAKKILAKGLKPRGRKKSNWDVQSHPDAVYLTTVYAIHFAQAAAKAKGDIAIIEIDSNKLDLDLFGPDEDFLEQATRGQFPSAGTTMTERTAWFRERAHSQFYGLWEQSLESLGTCAYYGAIPCDAITRVATLPAVCKLAFASDPVIVLMNHKLMGTYYRNLTRHVFGDSDFEEDPMQRSGAIPLLPRDCVEVK